MRPGVSEQELTAEIIGQADKNYQMSFACMRPSDVESRGKFRLPGDTERPLKAGEIVSISLSLSDDQTVATVSEMLLVTQDGAEFIGGKEI